MYPPSGTPHAVGGQTVMEDSPEVRTVHRLELVIIWVAAGRGEEEGEGREKIRRGEGIGRKGGGSGKEGRRGGEEEREERRRKEEGRVKRVEVEREGGEEGRKGKRRKIVTTTVSLSPNMTPCLARILEIKSYIPHIALTWHSPNAADTDNGG